MHQNWAGVIGPAASSVRVAGAAAAGAGCGRRLESRRRGRSLQWGLWPCPIGSCRRASGYADASFAVIHAKGSDAVPCIAADIPSLPSKHTPGHTHLHHGSLALLHRRVLGGLGLWKVHLVPRLLRVLIPRLLRLCSRLALAHHAHGALQQGREGGQEAQGGGGLCERESSAVTA